jgi:hypothetical protein
MLQLPRAHEEGELLPGLLVMGRVDVHDEARVVVPALRHAAVPEKRRHKLVEEQRLADAHLDRHRGLIIGHRGTYQIRRRSS